MKINLNYDMIKNNYYYKIFLFKKIVIIRKKRNKNDLIG